MKNKIAVLLLCIFVNFYITECSRNEVVADCTTICTCKENKQKFQAVEFRAVCEGDATQSVIVDDTLFKTEPIPDWTRKVYIRTANFTSIKVEESFFSRWLSYTSCSFDIWNSGVVSFPERIGKIAETEALSFVFTGIGVWKSSIDKFPADIFKDRSSVGIKLMYSEINYLNLLESSLNDLLYLTVKDSVIKVFEGKPHQSLKMKYSFTRGGAKIKIENSRIGYMGKGSMDLGDYESKTQAPVEILDSTIGVMERSSINVGKGIKFSLIGTILGYVVPSTFKFANPSENATIIAHNVIGLEIGSLKDLVCDTNLFIHENYIFPTNHLSGCLPSSSEKRDDTECKILLNITSYIDATCINNNIVGLFEIPKMTTESTSTTETFFTTTEASSTTETTSTSMPTTTTITDTAAPKKETVPEGKLNQATLISSKDPSVPVELFYLVVGLCILLILIVIVLTAVVICGKFCKKKTISSSKKFKRDTDIYEEPNAYFIPNPPPPLALDFEFDKGKKSEENRYESLTLGRKNALEFHEDDSVYLNMK